MVTPSPETMSGPALIYAGDLDDAAAACRNTYRWPAGWFAIVAAGRGNGAEIADRNHRTAGTQVLRDARPHKPLPRHLAGSHVG